MAEKLFIISDGFVPPPGGAVGATLRAVVADDEFADDGTTIIKTAAQAACEQVAAVTAITSGMLFAVPFDQVIAVQLDAEPVSYTTAVVELPAPGSDPPPG